MPGTICLQGGAEFSPGCRAMDAALVAACPGPVVVTALAGAEGREYDTATANGVRHYRSAGATDVTGAPDVRSDPAGALSALRAARLLVLPGGSPARLLRLLQETEVGEVLRALLDDDGTVMGSSAGAMVLGGWTVLPERGQPEVVPGLAVVPRVVVLPHYGGDRGGWLSAVDAAAPGSVVLGIPEESGVVVRDGVLTAVGVAPTRLVRAGRDLALGDSTDEGDL